MKVLRYRGPPVLRSGNFCWSDGDNDDDVDDVNDNGVAGERDHRGRQPVGAGRGVLPQACSSPKGETSYHIISYIDHIISCLIILYHLSFISYLISYV